MTFLVGRAQTPARSLGVRHLYQAHLATGAPHARFSVIARFFCRVGFLSPSIHMRMSCHGHVHVMICKCCSASIARGHAVRFIFGGTLPFQSCGNDFFRYLAFVFFAFLSVCFSIDASCAFFFLKFTASILVYYI